MISFVPQSATEQHSTEDPRKRGHANNVCGKIGQNLIEKKILRKLTLTFFHLQSIFNMEYFDFCFLNFGIRALRYISTWNT